MLVPHFGCLGTGGNMSHVILVLLFVRPLDQELSHLVRMLHLDIFLTLASLNIM